MRECHGVRGPGSIRRAGDGRRTSVVESVPSSSLRYMPAHTRGRDGAHAEQLARAAATARHTCGLSELRAGRREEGRVVEGEGGDAGRAVARPRELHVRDARLGHADDELDVRIRRRFILRQRRRLPSQSSGSCLVHTAEGERVHLLRREQQREEELEHAEDARSELYLRPKLAYFLGKFTCN